MKQYLNFADNGNCTRTEQAQYIFTEFVPTHRDNGSGGQIHRGTVLYALRDFLIKQVRSLLEHIT